MAYASIQIASVFVLMHFAFPPFSGVLVPIMEKYFGELALHYPNNFLVLPVMFFWFNVILSGLLGIFLVGTATVLFKNSFDKNTLTVGQSVRSTLPRYGYLFLIWVVETLLLVLVFIYVPKLLNQFTFFAQRGNLTKQLVTSFAAILAGSFFLYTTALVMLQKQGPIRAIAQSLSLCFRYPVITILLIALPNLVKMPMDLLAGRPQFLISKFTPEMVGVAIILSIFVSMFANYLLVGTVTGYFMSVNQRT